MLIKEENKDFEETNNCKERETYFLIKIFLFKLKIP